MQEKFQLLPYIERARKGDEEAFVVLFEQTHLLTYNLACVLLQDTEEAKDIVSEVYIRVFQHIAELRDPHSFIRWLTVITHNVCHDHLHGRTLPILPDGAADCPEDNIEEWLQKESLHNTIERMMTLLPEPQQRAVQDVYFHQLTLGEAAALEDCSINTIKSRLYYARETLRRIIEAEEKRTGDKLHLPAAAVCLAALMSLPQTVFTLTPAESAAIFSSVISALGTRRAAELGGMRVITALDSPEDAPAGRIGRLLHRRYLLKITPAAALLATVCLLAAVGLFAGAAAVYAQREDDLPAQTQAGDTPGSGIDPMPAPIAALSDETDNVVYTGTVSRQTSDDTLYRFTVEDGCAVICGVESTADILEIPASIDGYPVTAITEDAFAGGLTVARLILPDTLTAISGRTLAALTELEAVSVQEGSPYLTAIQGVLYSADGTTLIAYPNDKPGTSFTVPEAVRVIDAYAVNSRHLLTLDAPVFGIERIGERGLAGCIALTEFRLPASVTELGEMALACPAVTSFRVYAGSTSFYSVSDAILNHERTELIQYPLGKTSSAYTLPKSVTGIASHAFDGASYLTTIIMLDTVQTLAPYAVANVPRLARLDLSDSIESLPAHCLSGNDFILEYTLPAKLRTLDAQAMADCGQLAQITFRGAQPALTGEGKLSLANRGCTLIYPAGDDSWTDPAALGDYPTRRAD